MDDQQLHQTIEAYLRQQMPPEEAAAFEAQIAADPVLAEQVTYQRLQLRAIDRLAERSLQGKFARWRKEADAEEDAPALPIPVRKVNPWLFVVVVLLLFAGAFWIWKMWGGSSRDNREGEDKTPEVAIDSLHKNQVQEEPIASDQKPPDEKTARLLALSELSLNEYGKNLPSSIIRGGGYESPEDSLLSQADSLLKINQNNSAAALLKKIPPGSPFEPSALKRLAFVYHKLGQHTQAITTYEKYASLTPVNEEEHDWVLCLYYLADWPKREKEFNALLRKMTKDRNHGYRPKALELKLEMR